MKSTVPHAGKIVLYLTATFALSSSASASHVADPIDDATFRDFYHHMEGNDEQPAAIAPHLEAAVFKVRNTGVGWRLEIRDIRRRKPAQSIVTSIPYLITWAPSGDSIVFADLDEERGVYEYKEWRIAANELRTLGLPESRTANRYVEWNKSGSHFACYIKHLDGKQGSLAVYDIHADAYDSLLLPDGVTSDFDLWEDGRKVVYCGGSNHGVGVWDLESGKVRRLYERFLVDRVELLPGTKEMAITAYTEASEFGSVVIVARQAEDERFSFALEETTPSRLLAGDNGSLYIESEGFGKASLLRLDLFNRMITEIWSGLGECRVLAQKADRVVIRECGQNFDLF